MNHKCHMRNMTNVMFSTTPMSESMLNVKNVMLSCVRISSPHHYATLDGHKDGALAVLH